MVLNPSKEGQARKKRVRILSPSLGINLITAKSSTDAGVRLLGRVGNSHGFHLIPSIFQARVAMGVSLTASGAKALR